MGVIKKSDLLFKSPYAGYKILEEFLNERVINYRRDPISDLRYFTGIRDDILPIELYINGLAKNYYNPKTWELFSGSEDVCDYLGIENIPAPAEKYFSRILSVDWLYNKLQILDALRYLDVQRVLVGTGSWRSSAGVYKYDELYNRVNENITQYSVPTVDLDAILHYHVESEYITNILKANLVVEPCYISINEQISPDRKDILLKSEIELHYERTSPFFSFNDLGYDFVQEDGFVYKTKINETGMFPVFANPPKIPYVTKTNLYGRAYTLKYGYVDIRPFMQYTTTP